MVLKYGVDTNIEFPHIDIEYGWIDHKFNEVWFEKFFSHCEDTNEQTFLQSFVNYMIGKLTDEHWKKLISWIVDYEWVWLNIYPPPTENNGDGGTRRVCQLI